MAKSTTKKNRIISMVNVITNLSSMVKSDELISESELVKKSDITYNMLTRCITVIKEENKKLYFYLMRGLEMTPGSPIDKEYHQELKNKKKEAFRNLAFEVQNRRSR